MRKKKNIWILAFTIIWVLAACDKNDGTNNPSQDIEGTYVGNLTASMLKSALASTPRVTDATAEVTKIDDGEIEVHCYDDEVDTTFMLNYYDNDDSIMVCLTGSAFENMYGHMLGVGYMGGMMDGMEIGESEWMYHLRTEHQPGDEHFGGFDMQNHTFGYRFQMMNDSTLFELNFQGTKQN